jgi:predicted nuclease with TOPRIM domain
VSVAAAPMAAWVKANVQFSVVLEKVKPLEDDLAGLQASLDASRARVKQCEYDLASLDGTVSRLKEEFARRTGEAEALKIGLQQVRRKNEACMEVLRVSFGDHDKHLLCACERLLRVRFFSSGRKGVCKEWRCSRLTCTLLIIAFACRNS